MNPINSSFAKEPKSISTATPIRVYLLWATPLDSFVTPVAQGWACPGLYLHFHPVDVKLLFLEQVMTSYQMSLNNSYNHLYFVNHDVKNHKTNI